MPDQSYCAGLLHDRNPPRFTLCLFASPEKRETLFTLYAVLDEINRIFENAEDASAVQIRLKWWYDRIADCYNGTPPAGHPVLEEFARHLPENGQENAQNYIEEMQEMLLAETAEEGLAAAVMRCKYEEALAAAVLKVSPVSEQAEICGRTEALLAVPRRIAAKKEPLVPQSFWTDRQAVKTCVEQIREKITEQRKKWRKNAPPQSGRPLWLALSLAAQNLQRIVAADYDLQDARLLQPAPFSGIRLYLRSITGRY